MVLSGVENPPHLARDSIVTLAKQGPELDLLLGFKAVADVISQFNGECLGALCIGSR